MRERFDAGTGLVAVGAVLLLVSLFIDWYDPAATPGSSSSRSTWRWPAPRRGLMASRRASRGLGRALPIISVSALAVVIVQLIYAAARRARLRPRLRRVGRPRRDRLMALGAILAAASISVTVDVRERERRRRTAAIDARESAAEEAEADRGGRGRAPRGPAAAAPARRAPARAARARARPPRSPRIRSAPRRSSPWTARSDERRRRRPQLRAPRLRRRTGHRRGRPARARGPLPRRDPSAPRLPRLMAETDDGSREVAPAAADEAHAEPDGGLWRAATRVALELLDDGSFALAVGRELSSGCRRPTWPSRAASARSAWPARPTRCAARPTRRAPRPPPPWPRSARAPGARGDRGRDGRGAHGARRPRPPRAPASTSELTQLRREHAAELVRRDEERAAALAGRDEEAAEAADERVAELEAEAAEARRGLRAARAEAEAMRRDLERERERAEAAEAAVRRGRVTELDGEPVKAGRRRRAADDRGRPRRRGGPGRRARRRARGRDRRLDPRRPRPATEVAERPPRPPCPATSAARTPPRSPPRAPEPVAGDPGETVRVLGARRPRRTGEGTPAEAAPGTAAIGARHIEPGQTPQRSAVAAWLRAPRLRRAAVVVLALLWSSSPSECPDARLSSKPRPGSRETDEQPEAARAHRARRDCRGSRQPNVLRSHHSRLLDALAEAPRARRGEALVATSAAAAR